MCILFVYINNDCKARNEYQLIIANNRDEFYWRPTNQVERWGENKTCISGLDMAPGKEGGTWLGLNTKGRFASVLNIMVDRVGTKKKGRGFLVTDFLKSNINADQYARSIDKEKDQYNGFNLVLLNRIDQHWKLTYYSNQDPISPYVVETDTSGYGNAIHRTPWQKVLHGTPVFESICREYNSTNQNAQLRKTLLNFLNNNKPNIPDLVLESQENCMKKYCRETSSCHVRIPALNYGTRTNTIISVDKEGNGEYFEGTLKDSINLHRPEWKTRIIPFKLEC